MLALQQVTTILQTALAEARRRKLAALGIAVLDAGGRSCRTASP